MDTPKKGRWKAQIIEKRWMDIRKAQIIGNYGSRLIQIKTFISN
jgi:hypothetical protein